MVGNAGIELLSIVTLKYSRKISRAAQKTLCKPDFFFLLRWLGFEFWFVFFHLRFHFPFFCPSLTQPRIHHPPYIHHHPDYANMGPFMSSELRILSSPRVCKEAHYQHWPIVEYSLQSAANPLPLFSVLPSVFTIVFSAKTGQAPEKHQAGRWDLPHIGITVKGIRHWKSIGNVSCFNQICTNMGNCIAIGRSAVIVVGSVRGQRKQ